MKFKSFVPPAPIETQGSDKSFIAVLVLILVLAVAFAFSGCAHPINAPSVSAIKTSIGQAQKANQAAIASTTSAQGHLRDVSKDLSNSDNKATWLLRYLDK